jgi:5'(3')-deoxyribonucleotidase
VFGRIILRRKMSVLKIAIDFDETLFPTLERVLEIYNKRHNVNIESSQITTYNLHDSFPSEIADEILEVFIEKDAYTYLQPYKGAVRAVKTLAEQGHEVYVATSTDVRNMEWKEELLHKYFPFIPKKNLIRIHNKALLNVDVLVEDKLDNLKSIFADRICFNQPWNIDEDADYVYSIYRIHHWGEIINVINNIERKNKEWEK